MKIIQVNLDENTHGDFKTLCAREKIYMKAKLEELIKDYVKSVKSTSKILNN